ncbi:hypothetical protein DUNSADRAFT_4739, partial [Dunaliella salina]
LHCLASTFSDEITQPVYESRHPHLKPYRNASSKLYLQPHSTFPAEEQAEQAQQQPDSQQQPQQPQQQQDRHQQQELHGPSSTAPLAPPPPQQPRSNPVQPPRPPQYAGPGRPSAMEVS